MNTPGAVMAKLDSLAEELDARSLELAQTERSRASVADEYDDFLDSFLVGLHEKCEDEGKRLPGDKEIRLSMARQAMPAELLGNYKTLTRRSERLRRRIADLKVEVDVQRSVLSALKAELEATR